MDTEVFPLLLPKDAVVPWTQNSDHVEMVGQIRNTRMAFFIAYPKNLGKLSKKDSHNVVALSPNGTFCRFIDVCSIQTTNSIIIIMKLCSFSRLFDLNLERQVVLFHVNHLTKNPIVPLSSVTAWGHMHQRRFVFYWGRAGRGFGFKMIA